MAETTRRAVIRGGVVAAASIPLTAGIFPAAEAEAGCTAASTASPVGPGDPRYPSLTSRGYNRRLTGAPGRIHVPGSTDDVVRAVGDAVQSGGRVTVRSGGHCFEDFVDAPDVRTLIDLAELTEVRYDRSRNAFAIGPGATLGTVYRKLYLGWGVTIPAGTHSEVGVGGHIAGGGYGALCRLHGLTVDHLYAVEVVVVDPAGRARAVVATRELSDPNRDLWWAHTGGGGGSFGVVTRYWFRSPQARHRDDPGRLLPRPSATVLNFSAEWRWESLTHDDFHGLVRNYGEWAERNAAPGSPASALYTEFLLSGKPAKTITLHGQVAADSGAERLREDLLTALTRGVTGKPVVHSSTLPWLTAATFGWPTVPGPFYRLKIKSSYLRRGFTDEQIATAYRYLSSDDTPPGGLLFLNTYGGLVNTVAPDATATAHRDSVLLLGYMAGWADATEDARNLDWVRGFYRDMYASTGGVPATDGAFINYQDADLADPRLNPSGTPWHVIYFKDNYHRLQQAKRRWDPRDVFRHQLSIRPV